MSEIKKSYYAIIPANVRYDEDLTPNAKLLYGEITALCNEKGFCWAGDKYFSDLYNVNRTTIQRWMKQLEKNGYISREVKYREGTLEIEHRYTYLCDKGTRKNETTPTRKNETVNTTSINTTINNTSNKKRSSFGDNKNVMLTEDEIKKLQDSYPDYKQRINDLSYYLSSTGKTYKSHYMTLLSWARKEEKSKGSQKNISIKDRLKELS